MSIIDIHSVGDHFMTPYGLTGIPSFQNNPDGTVDLRDIPDVTTFDVDYVAKTEAEGGIDCRGVRLTITRDNGGMQLTATAANGEWRWELERSRALMEGARFVEPHTFLVGRLISPRTPR